MINLVDYYCYPHILSPKSWVIYLSLYMCHCNIILESICLYILPRFLLVYVASILQFFRCISISIWARSYSTVTRLCWDLNFYMQLETMRVVGDRSSEETAFSCHSAAPGDSRRMLIPLCQKALTCFCW